MAERKTKRKRKPGRPSKYAPALGRRICRMIVAGDSLRRICARKDMPTVSTLMLWVANNPGFSEQYTRAKEFQADLDADDIRDIADNATPETAAVDKLRMEARKWNAARRRPRKYGDRVHNEHSGPDDGPIRLERNSTDPDEMTNEELLERLKQLREERRGKKD